MIGGRLRLEDPHVGAALVAASEQASTRPTHPSLAILGPLV